MPEQNLSFELSLRRIEEIVKSLETGSAALDESMKLFEEGTSLIRRCGEMLDKAEQQVVRLKKGPDGEPQELPFDAQE